MFVIYEKPKDHPEHFVVREWRVLDTGAIEVSTECQTAETLDGARCHVPKGLYQTAPDKHDDPVIKEVWL